MTTARVAHHQFGIGPWRGTRTTDTFRRQLLMAEQRAEIAARITELRERSPYTQPQIAEKLGITLRAYQRLELRGTTKFARCEELAAIHSAWTKGSASWSHVTAEWIWDGRIVPDETPDLIAVLPPAWATRMEAKLDALLRADGLSPEEIVAALPPPPEELLP